MEARDKPINDGLWDEGRGGTHTPKQYISHDHRLFILCPLCVFAPVVAWSRVQTRLPSPPSRLCVQTCRVALLQRWMTRRSCRWGHEGREAPSFFTFFIFINATNIKSYMSAKFNCFSWIIRLFSFQYFMLFKLFKWDNSLKSSLNFFF